MGWDSTNRILTAPLGISDVMAATGYAIDDAGNCIAYGTIAKFAKFKPQRASTVVPLKTDAERKASRWGFKCFKGDGNTQHPAYETQIERFLSNYAHYYDYQRPLGTSTSPYRPGDFLAFVSGDPLTSLKGYTPDSPNPVTEFEMPTEYEKAAYSPVELWASIIWADTNPNPDDNSLNIVDMYALLNGSADLDDLHYGVLLRRTDTGRPESVILIVDTENSIADSTTMWGYLLSAVDLSSYVLAGESYTVYPIITDYYPSEGVEVIQPGDTTNGYVPHLLPLPVTPVTVEVTGNNYEDEYITGYPKWDNPSYFQYYGGLSAWLTLYTKIEGDGEVDPESGEVISNLHSETASVRIYKGDKATEPDDIADLIYRSEHTILVGDGERINTILSGEVLPGRYYAGDYITVFLDITGKVIPAGTLREVFTIQSI